VCILRTLPERTLRKRTGAGTGLERKQAKRLILKRYQSVFPDWITVDTIQGSSRLGFPVFMCCYRQTVQIWEGRDIHFENLKMKRDAFKINCSQWTAK